MSTNTSAGWYYAQGDPPGTQRYWDGAQWIGGPKPVAPPAPTSTSIPQAVQPDPTPAAVPQRRGLTTLTVRRRRQIQNALVPVGVNMDGYEVAGLRAGQSYTTEVDAGEYTLSFNPSQSAKTPISTWDGGDIEVEIWVSTFTSGVRARVHKAG